MTIALIRPHSALVAALALALTFATPASAQDAADDTADETPAPTSPGGDLTTGQSVGQALGGGPEIYVREEHGDWEIRCLKAPEGQDDPCQLYQRLADQQGNPTADVNFFDLPDGNEIVAGATVLTPLQTLLTAQVTMTVDGGQPRRYPYSFCDTTGCYSRMGFTAEDIAAFKRGAKATLIVVPALAPDQRAELTMSLTGFTAGMAAIEVANDN
ncbi:invasion associated locus B family protein [Jannaschia helgolandensis]|uniref:invasion associated locus B family protein n=1 Tax=Jannaschia helgolandensis TaxID=188906 RepID=UPI0030D9BC0C